MNITYFDINGVPSKLFHAENAHGTVLAIHGFGGSKNSGAIAGLAERVCPAGLNVLAFDLPAHGERNGGAEELDPRRCIAEILAAEEYIRSETDGDMYAFATSFGAMCMLHRISSMKDNFRRIVLRVPAVNMARSLFAISRQQDSSLTPEKAAEQGFHVTIGREYHIPYSFYEQLKVLHCLRTDAVWNSNRIMTVYADADELVNPSDTAEFLHHNPLMRSVCINGATHRMPEPQHLSDALDAAYEFFMNNEMK